MSKRSQSMTGIGAGDKVVHYEQTVRALPTTSWKTPPGTAAQGPTRAYACQTRLVLTMGGVKLSCLS